MCASLEKVDFEAECGRIAGSFMQIPVSVINSGATFGARPTIDRHLPSFIVSNINLTIRYHSLAPLFMVKSVKSSLSVVALITDDNFLLL